MSALGQKSRNVRWPRRDTANNRINVTEKDGTDRQTEGETRNRCFMLFVMDAASVK